jgi:hypothetical protein
VTDREIVLGAAMFGLLLAVALSIALIAWDRRAPSRSRALFASDRERRLWLWALVAVVAIYASLGPARTLAGWLRDRNLLRLSMALALLLAVAAIAVGWARRRPSLGEIGVALGVAAVYGMVWVRVETLEERTHLFEYGLVAVLIYQALLERQRRGRRVPVPALLAIAATALLGWLDEGIQALLPHRVYDRRDAGVNALAGLVAIAASLALSWARQRFGGSGQSIAPA